MNEIEQRIEEVLKKKIEELKYNIKEHPKYPYMISKEDCLKEINKIFPSKDDYIFGENQENISELLRQNNVWFDKKLEEQKKEYEFRLKNIEDEYEIIIDDLQTKINCLNKQGEEDGK